MQELPVHFAEWVISTEGNSVLGDAKAQAYYSHVVEEFGESHGLDALTAKELKTKAGKWFSKGRCYIRKVQLALEQEHQDGFTTAVAAAHLETQFVAGLLRPYAPPRHSLMAALVNKLASIM